MRAAGPSSADLLIVGGGITGLAASRQILRRRPHVRLVLLEKEPQVATHQTGRNSGVIHSGIYYPAGSLKAKTCVAGAAAMRRFCERHAIPLRVVGKLIVANTDQERARLKVLRERGEANGVKPLVLLREPDLRDLEPRIAGREALLLPDVAITDFSAVAREMARQVIELGGRILTGQRAGTLRRQGTQWVVSTPMGEYTTPNLLLAAGVYTDRLARMAGADPGVRIIPFRGEYQELVPARRDLARRLVYPVPDPGLPFLGVHLTPTVDGRLLAGPNAVLALHREGYAPRMFNPRDAFDTLGWPGFWRFARRHWRTGLTETSRAMSRTRFLQELRRLAPSVTAADLVPAPGGIRAQAMAPDGSLVDDFRIARSPGLMALVNVPSPAATASLAIAQLVADQAEGCLDLPGKPLDLGEER